MQPKNKHTLEAINRLEKADGDVPSREVQLYHLEHAKTSALIAIAEELELANDLAMYQQGVQLGPKFQR